MSPPGQDHRSCCTAALAFEWSHLYNDHTIKREKTVYVFKTQKKETNYIYCGYKVK